MTLMNIGISVGQDIGLLIPIDSGTRILFPSIAIAIQVSVNPKYVGIATAVFSFLRTLSLSFGVAICRAIFTNVMVKNADDIRGLASKASYYSQDIFPIVTLLQSLSTNDPRRIALVKSLFKITDYCWPILIGFAGAGPTSLFSETFSTGLEHKSKQKLVQTMHTRDA
ncbi:hypothetical protein V1511DRAFT_508175 [Dipodascopsis uninucleata]